MRDRPAYLPFYIRDFFSDPNVLRMTWTQQAVYLRMLCVSWEMGALPASDMEVARMINQESLEPDVGAVRKLAWSTDGDGNSTNPRLERERLHWLEVHSKKKNGGKEGNRRRWDSSQDRSEPDRTQADAASDTDRSPTEPPSDSDRNTQAQEQAQEQEQEQPDLSASLRSAGADKPRRRNRARQEAAGPHREAIRAWDALWLENRGVPFAWNGREASAIAACLVHAGGDLELFTTRAARLLRDPPDAWFAQNASPAILESRWNQLVVRVARRTPTLDERNAQTLRATAEELLREA